MSDLLTHPHNVAFLIPADADKDTRSRLSRFVDWIEFHSRTWYDADLAAYRDFLLRVGGNDGNGLSPSSVSAHLSTIRGRYRQLLQCRQTTARLYQIAGVQLERMGAEDTPANRAALVGELRVAIRDAIHPDAAPVEVVEDQDPDHLRLTVAQANALMRRPAKRRDRAVIAFLLATGIREGELCALRLEDLRARMDDGSLAVRVRKGKGAKARKVPYGEHERVLRVVDAWLEEAAITGGRVFPLSERTVQRIVGGYSVFVDGRDCRVKPHDLRRTYARRLYEAGVDLTAIQQNLGHADLRTTLLYVGQLDASARKPPEVFDFDL